MQSISFYSKVIGGEYPSRTYSTNHLRIEGHRLHSTLFFLSVFPIRVLPIGSAVHIYMSMGGGHGWIIRMTPMQPYTLLSIPLSIIYPFIYYLSSYLLSRLLYIICSIIYYLFLTIISLPPYPSIL